MFAGQGDVEYVYINQATGEYKIIPESEVSVCQGADGATILVYSGAQEESEGLETKQEQQPEQGCTGVAEDFLYVEEGGEAGDIDQPEYAKHEEVIVEVGDDEQALNESIDHAREDIEEAKESEDTRFVMVSEQEVLVVKKAGGASRNAYGSPFEHSSNSVDGYGRNRMCPSMQKSMDYENRPTANSEARLMKSRRRAPPQSQKKGPKLIQDFLLPHLDNETFGNRLVWVDRPAGTFAMSWSHKNGAEWRVDDCIVFREWDRLKQREVAENHPQYWMESKQRFRSALAKVSIPCTTDSEEFKSSKIFQIKWTRETRPDILDRVYSESKYFELPPRGSMGRQETIFSHEQVTEGFLVEAYTEEEVVASTSSAYSPNQANVQVDDQDIEIIQPEVEDQEFVDTEISSATEVVGTHTELQAGQNYIQCVQHVDHNSHLEEQNRNPDLGNPPMVESVHDAAAQQAAAAVLSSRFFTERKRLRRANRRSIRKEALRPVEKVLRRCKRPLNRVYTICPLCRFFSANYAVLLRHLMVHRDDRAFACLHCTQGFKLPELLLNHLREHHHAGTPNFCSLSSLEAKSLSNLRRAELQLVHRNLRTCAVCAEHCFREHDLMAHVQELHGVDALRDVRQAALSARRNSRTRMRLKFTHLRRAKKRHRYNSGNGGSARTGGSVPKAKEYKLLRNDENQTSLVVCDGEVLIEETPVDWGEQVLE
ncbi:hypothetical protein BIW11_11936 [Tropilaelaps mercedesae]|uniref:C2H2-type domain-containing protein n=1 Tax=Tropilaelaps mercedesae TaxID=418985 RepID=A0A1V9X9H2_9ACAR|nr:hypothetical protein BIW11_11936 [Tropilaelaps mercedesae]